MLDLLCTVSPAIGASVLLALALVSIVARQGGTIDTVKIPGLADVKLKTPFVLTGSRFLLALSVSAFVGAVALAVLQAAGGCERCDGMPGETAWIYGGEKGVGDQFNSGPFFVPEKAGFKASDVKSGDWIKLTESRKTMILDYDTLQVKRAMDSPFMVPGRIVYTCKVFAVGQRLYVADKRVNGPSQDVQHVWLRVRMKPPGG